MTNILKAVRAMADHYGYSRQEIVDGLRDDDFALMSYDDAEAQAREYIKESLWAFNSSFLHAYLPDGVGTDVIDMLQEKCEGANDAILAMVGDNLSELTDDAIGCDGLGHFLCSYDGNALELDGVVGWRVN